MINKRAGGVASEQVRRQEANGRRKAGAFVLGVALAALPVVLAWVGFPALALYDEAARTHESACLATRNLFLSATATTGLVVGALLMVVLLVVFALAFSRGRRFLAYGIATGLVIAPVIADVGCQVLVQLPCGVLEPRPSGRRSGVIGLVRRAGVPGGCWRAYH